MSFRFTKRQAAARAALIDAATEVASLLGSAHWKPRATVILTEPCAAALNELYRANDELQEAHLAAYAAYEKSFRRKKKAGGK